MRDGDEVEKTESVACADHCIFAPRMFEFRGRRRTAIRDQLVEGSACRAIFVDGRRETDLRLGRLGPYLEANAGSPRGMFLLRVSLR